MTTFKFVKHCDCHNHITKNATLLDIWLDLFLKSVGKQVQGNKFEAHFNTRPTNISCSKDVLTEDDNEKISPQLDNLLSTDNMLVEFQSNNIFGDTN